jgi:hypothetical protein
MAPNSSLTCNFTLQSDLSLGVSFQSNNGGMNYGGQITIFTPSTVGPVTTGLWDSDGNVFFTIYDATQSGAPTTASCTINSGSIPGSFSPYVVVSSEAGLSCVISEPQQSSENVYNYTLTITMSEAVRSGPKHVTNMVLPNGGKQAWTLIMQGQSPVPEQINTGAPIVMAHARFDDGTQVAGGVYKSDTPTDYNIKFMWVLDAKGNQYPGWPIDVSDDEDFLADSYRFSLIPGGEADYILNIRESKE